MNKIVAVLLCASIVSAPVLADEKLTEEIQQVIDRMAEIYQNDPNGSRQIFDELWLQDDNIVYLSEQFVQAFYGFSPVASYWKPSWNTLYGYREIYSNLRVTRLDKSLAMATFDNRYDMHAVTRTPLAGWTRLTLILRKTDDDWKIQQFYETPMSLLSQGRRIHEESLDPNFVQYARGQNPQYDELVNADENIKVRKEGPPWVPRPRFRPPVWNSAPAESQQETSTK